MSRRWWGAQSALLLGGVGAALLGWWLIGDLSFTGEAGKLGLDYALRPPQLSEATVRAAAVVGAWLLAGAVLALLTLVRRRRLRWLRMLAEWVVLGFLLAFGGRTATAGVVGADIGLGFFVVVVLPVMVATAVLLVVLSVRRGADVVT